MQSFYVDFEPTFQAQHSSSISMRLWYFYSNRHTRILYFNQYFTIESTLKIDNLRLTELNQASDRLLTETMSFFWIFFLLHVMPWGHGGDGGRGCGRHKLDVVPPQRRSGKAENLNLTIMWEKKGRWHLPLVFDKQGTAATYTTIGDIHDLFIRDVGTYMWLNISLDRRSWAKVSDAEKNSMFEHFRALIIWFLSVIVAVKVKQRNIF